MTLSLTDPLQHASANLIGNALAAGGLGVMFSGPSQNMLVLNNDFGGVTLRGIGASWAYGTNAITSALIISNAMDEGASVHLQAPATGADGWFLNRNAYYSKGTQVNPFTDPASSSIHITK